MGKYTAFLRGINVGGHHKVPMKELSLLLNTLGCKNVQTLLNSGNVIFESEEKNAKQLETLLDQKLEQHFGFAISVIVRKADEVLALYQSEPFNDIELTSDIRLYITFLKEQTETEIALPWKSEDGTFTILELNQGIIISVLDLSRSKTPKGMEALEKLFGKNITTRNWNTIVKIAKKI
jgi:uncharacterized protein (DUF1697 family)